MTAMRWPNRTRKAIFVIGVIAIGATIALLLVGYLFPPKETDYLAQDEQVIPVLQWGLGLAIIGSFLCFFGRGWQRSVLVVGGFSLAAFWFLLGGASL
jgi:hypothetical protein